MRGRKQSRRPRRSLRRSSWEEPRQPSSSQVIGAAASGQKERSAADEWRRPSPTNQHWDHLHPLISTDCRKRQSVGEPAGTAPGIARIDQTVRTRAALGMWCRSSWMSSGSLVNTMSLSPASSAMAASATRLVRERSSSRPHRRAATRWGRPSCSATQLARGVRSPRGTLSGLCGPATVNPLRVVIVGCGARLFSGLG